MGAYETFNDILSTENLPYCDLRWCYVNKNKVPFKIDGTAAKPNNVNDFVEFHKLAELRIFEYEGLGISIQASNICAIDIDHCVENPFSINNTDTKANEIINLFKDIAYIEYSFSGTGLRILFRHNIISNYEEQYYIKNSKNQIEFYQPSDSNRYVTITGKYLYNNPIKICPDLILNSFLDKYMLRPKKARNIQNMEHINDNRDINELLELVKTLYRKDFTFQDVWFGKAPGAGKDESEKDYYILKMLFNNITQDKDKLREVFEHSPYFNSKDRHHVYKWNYNNYRYYNWVYDNIMRGL